MRIVHAAVALIIIIASAPCVLFSADAPTTRPAEPARYAVVDVSFANQAYLIKPEKMLDHVYARAAELAPKLVGLDEKNLKDWLEIGYSASTAGVTNIQMTVNLFDANAKPAAKAFADAIIEDLKKFYEEGFAHARDEAVRPLEQQVNKAQQQMDDAHAMAESLRQDIRKLADRSDVSTIPDAVNKMEEEHTHLELDVLAKQARRDALEKQVAAQSQAIDRQIASDPIVAELQKVVDAREEKVKLMNAQAEKGMAATAEVRDGIAQAAEARVKLLQRKREAMLEAGGDTIAALNKELLTLSVDLRELGARLDYANERLPRLRQALDLSEKYAKAERDANRAKNDLQQAQRELDKAGNQFAEPPEMLVTSREVREHALDPHVGHELVPSTAK